MIKEDFSKELKEAIKKREPSKEGELLQIVEERTIPTKVIQERINNYLTKETTKRAKIRNIKFFIRVGIAASISILIYKWFDLPLYKSLTLYFLALSYGELLND